MNFDPEQIARLAQFARELDAAPGERHEDLQQAQVSQREAAHAELNAKIAKLNAEAEAIREASEDLWSRHSEQQRNVHRDITENSKLSDRQRMARLVELLQSSYDLAAIRHFESNIAAYQALRRTQHWFERKLERMQNES